MRMKDLCSTLKKTFRYIKWCPEVISLSVLGMCHCVARHVTSVTGFRFALLPKWAKYCAHSYVLLLMISSFNESTVYIRDEPLPVGLYALYQATYNVWISNFVSFQLFWRDWQQTYRTSKLTNFRIFNISKLIWISLGLKKKYSWVVNLNVLTVFCVVTFT